MHINLKWWRPHFCETSNYNWYIILRSLGISGLSASDPLTQVTHLIITMQPCHRSNIPQTPLSPPMSTPPLLHQLLMSGRLLIVRLFSVTCLRAQSAPTSPALWNLRRWSCLGGIWCDQRGLGTWSSSWEPLSAASLRLWACKLGCGKLRLLFGFEAEGSFLPRAVFTGLFFFFFNFVFIMSYINTYEPFISSTWYNFNHHYLMFTYSCCLPKLKMYLRTH